MARKLFLVEFGTPDVGGYASYTYGELRSAFVIANTYDEAAEKALAFAQFKSDNKVITMDGSLAPAEVIKIKSVKLACEEIVW